MTVRRLHRGLALCLALFLALHLGNHLAGVFGQDVHGLVQTALRPIYRHPVIEPVLILALIVQIGLGLRLLTRRAKVTTQTLSGAYLAVFLLVHLGAVFAARLQGIDTDLAFAAAGLHAGQPWPILFGFYYGLAVLSVFAHLSVPLDRRLPGLGPLVLVIGTTLSALVVALLAGLVTPLSIPSALILAFP